MNNGSSQQMKKKFFLKNFFLFIIPTLIPILILGTFTVLISNNYNKDVFQRTNAALLNQMSNNMDLILNELDELNLNFNYHIDISVQMKKLLESPSYSLEDYRLSELVEEFISTPANSKPYIHCIYMYFNNSRGAFISSSDGLNTLDTFNDTSWFESFTAHENENWWTEIRHISHYDFEEKTPVLTAYRKMHSPGVTKANGVIVLNIYLGYMQKELEDLVTYQDQSLFVLDENGKYLFGNDMAQHLSDEDLTAIDRTDIPYFRYRAKSDRYNVFKLKSEGYGWTYISVVPDSSFNQVSNRLTLLTIALLVLSLFLVVFLVYYLTRLNRRNIERIISIIDSAENQRPLPPLPDAVRDEYSYIVHNILKTFLERSYLKLQLSERKYKQQAAELLSLQSQINPHFLHNTLETIYWEMLRFSKKPTIAHKMLENLSDILKYSLNSKDNFVSLEEEIRNTVSYIEIQKFRHEDKFDVFWEYSEDVNTCKVKKMILQPLVENSIYHGIQEGKEHCVIRIKIIKTASKLRIFLADNGAGIFPDRLAGIRRKLDSAEDLSGHIGLFNTNKRLKLTYGDEYGIKIRSQLGVGTVVYLRIPTDD